MSRISCVVLPMAMLLSVALRAAESLPEEIVVTNLTLKNLRADLVRAEDDMHAIFNNLVNDEFRIICEDVTITGSLIETRSCEPNYRRRAKTRFFREAQDGGPDRLRFQPDSRQLTSELEGKNREMQELMGNLVRENPEFAAAVANVLNLQNAIAAEGGELQE